MKRIHLLAAALLALAVAPVQAKTRTAAQMLSAAKGVLTHNSLLKSTVNPTGAPLSVLKTEPQLTLIGYANGACAVIANDDAFDAVLGYMDRYDATHVAPGFLWWVEAMNASLEERLQSGDTQSFDVSLTDAKNDHVDQLMTTQWGQDTPFNNLCPTYQKNNTDVHYVTGCVATAMAQIMKYHEYPKVGGARINYRYTDDVTGSIVRITARPDTTHYDYAHMLDVYSSKVGYTDAEANAVATLMLHAGASIEMGYTTSGSGAYISKACTSLRKTFLYQEYIPYYDRRVMSKTEWMDIIYRELDDHCPVLYGGVSNSGGHCFVFDGYDNSGRVHVNWGWNGSSDGYFEVASLNGYTSQQQMVPMRTREDSRVTYGYKSLFGNPNGSVSMTYNVGKVRASSYAYNFDVLTFSGSIGLLALNLSTGKTTALTTTSVSSVATYGGANLSLEGDPSSLADGTYRLYIGTKATSPVAETEWQPLRTPENYANSYLMTITGGNVSISRETNNSGWMTGIGEVKVNKAGTSGPVRVYDTTGRMVYTAPAATFSLSDVPAQGLLIIKQGAESKKVVKD